MSRMPVCIASIVAVFITVRTVPAFTQSKEDHPVDPFAGESDLYLTQTYHGTIPGNGNNLPHVEELKNKPGAWLTWPGFVMLPNGGSRIFLQTTKTLDFERKTQKKRVSLSFRNTSVFLTNNRNPLVTTHFNTPVRTARLKRQRNSVVLIIELKVPCELEVTQYTDKDGYSYLIIDFPAGDYPIGGDWGNRPSFSGFGKPGNSETSQSEESSDQLDTTEPE